MEGFSVAKVEKRGFSLANHYYAQGHITHSEQSRTNSPWNEVTYENNWSKI
jgi:hypothetical protein